MRDSTPPLPSPQSPGSWPWLRERLFPHGTNLIQWAPYIIIIALLILQVLRPPEVPGFLNFSSITALAILLVINIVWDDLRGLFPREDTGNLVLLLTEVGLTFYTFGIGRQMNAIYLVFMIAAQANAMLPSLPALAFTLLESGAFLGVMKLLGFKDADLANLFSGLLVGMAFTVTLGQVLYRYIEQDGKMKRLLEELRQANQELVEAREKEKELVIAEERVRMARDLHDGLGHHLTALSIQLQAAEKLIHANPELTAETIHNARGEVQAALKEVRQSVAALRETPVDIHNLPEAIRKLVEEAGRTSGLKTRFEQQGQPENLAPAAAMTLFRAAQEGLTNVQKHATGAQVICVRLDNTPQETCLSVEDDGQNPPDCPDAAAGGFGLAGLRERAILLGGRLECGPRPEGGFRLAISLPGAAPEGKR